MPCSEIRAEWAAQRIKGLSLGSAALGALGLGGKRVKSLIDSFHYPRLGPGMLWEKVCDSVSDKGGEIHLNSPVTQIHHSRNSIESVKVRSTSGDIDFCGTHFISSIPLSHLIRFLDPSPPKEIQAAADALRYRDLITVNLILNRADIFPDNWIYVHNPDVQVARIQNYKNWSSDMVPDPDHTVLGLEYFCSYGDKIWSLTDDDLVKLAQADLEATGLAGSTDFLDGLVFRERYAYPMYNGEYREYLSVIKGYLSQFRNLQMIGRNGLHKYNNQDHSMQCALYAVRNLFGSNYDLWTVNSDLEYQEEIAEHELAPISKQLP